MNRQKLASSRLAYLAQDKVFGPPGCCGRIFQCIVRSVPKRPVKRSLKTHKHRRRSDAIRLELHTTRRPGCEGSTDLLNRSHCTPSIFSPLRSTTLRLPNDEVMAVPFVSTMILTPKGRLRESEPLQWESFVEEARRSQQIQSPDNVKSRRLCPRFMTDLTQLHEGSMTTAVTSGWKSDACTRLY